MADDKRPTTVDVNEAKAILREIAAIRADETKTTEEVENLTNTSTALADILHAEKVLRNAEKYGVRERQIVPPPDKVSVATRGQSVLPRRAKGGLIKKKKMRHGGVHTKRPQMVHGGAYKGKKHSYAAGGAVKDTKMMGTK